MKEAKKDKSFKMYSAVSGAKIDFAFYVHQNRKRLKISQTKLAKKAETTQRIISRIENTTYNPGLELIAKIKFILNDTTTKGGTP